MSTTWHQIEEEKQEISLAPRAMETHEGKRVKFGDENIALPNAHKSAQALMPNTAAFPQVPPCGRRALWAPDHRSGLVSSSPSGQQSVYGASPPGGGLRALLKFDVTRTGGA